MSNPNRRKRGHGRGTAKGVTPKDLMMSMTHNQQYREMMGADGMNKMTLDIRKTLQEGNRAQRRAVLANLRKNR